MRAAIFIAFLLFIPGCLQSIGSNDYSNYYAESLKDRLAISDPEKLAECKEGQCWCMVCQNGTNIFGSAFTSLIGAHCYMETECDQEAVNDLISTEETPDLAIRRFMLGQGPTIADFADANPLCNYGLGMAVQWLQGNPDSPYSYPDVGRSMCLLSKNVVPVYVLYSKGKNIDNSRAYAIGDRLGTGGKDFWLAKTSGPVGPVIVVTEIDFDSSDVNLVAEQIVQVNNGCNKGDERYCWIAVAPKFNDRESLDAVMDQVPEGSVDLIAFGINGSSVDACKDGKISTAKMMTQIKNFTEYALYNWSKPTIIPYVLFEPGSKDAGGCEWTESDVVDAYKAFWPSGIQRLRDLGTIGIAPYSFNSTTFGSVSNPLGCKNCAVASNTMRLRAWYGSCQAYNNITRKNELDHPGGGTPIIFPNESGVPCDQSGAQMDYLLRETSYLTTGGERDIRQAQLPELRKGMNQTYACSACLVTKAAQDITPPFDFAKYSKAGGYGTNPGEVCSMYPEIDHWADARGVDRMFVRAFILTEAGFDPCAAARTCKPGYDDGNCFPASECYWKAYWEMHDPTYEAGEGGGCPFTNDDVSLSKEPPQQPRWKWCGLGIMQAIVPPYTFWPASHYPVAEGEQEIEGQYHDVFEKAGTQMQTDAMSFMDEARGCASETDPPGQFNPFNVSHSVCLGTYAIAKVLDAGRNNVDEFKSAGLLDFGDEDLDKSSALAGWFAAMHYTGFSSITTYKSSGGVSSPCNEGETMIKCLKAEFKNSQSVDKEYCESEAGQKDTERCKGGLPRKEPGLGYCYGYTDLVEFYNDCIKPYLPRPADPGSDKMDAYYYLLNCPNNFCPDGTRVVESLCIPDPETQEYDHEMCLGPGQPKYPTSESWYTRD